MTGEIRARSVVLGYVHDGNVRAEFMRSVLDALPDERLLGVIDATAGSLIPKARNLLVERFLSTVGDWLWMVDTDVVFTARALYALAAVADPAHRPLVSGVVPVIRADGSTVASIWRIASANPLRFEPVEDWQSSEIVEADAVGAACLLAHRSVFEKIHADEGPAWFLPMTVKNGVVGEDLSFCLRAASAGVLPAVVTGVRCGHVKPIQVGSLAP
jgi:GT2 family glycosyltransferase